MEPFDRLSSRAVPMREANLDTDSILPSRFMQKPRSTGFGAYFFHDLRFDGHGAAKPGFILNDPAYRGARILIAGANFGCGSSREQAVYAIVDYGFRAVIAPSFGDIFFANALKNGLLPIVLGDADVEELSKTCRSVPSTLITVRLATQTVSRAGGRTISFAIDEFHKELLLSGRDEIAYTLDFLDAIDAFESRRRSASVWL